MSRRTRNNVGLIGLGIIGQRVADSLRRNGFQAYVWNRSPKPVQNFVGSAAEVAQLCDFIQIFVSNDEALAQTVQQLAPELNAQHIVLAHCTVAPASMRAAAEVVQRRGARFLDAPFTGSKLAAEKGELVYYIGGDEAALKHARAVLEASSKAIVHVGDIGQATVMKIATNMITAATVQVAAEALALVQKSGLAPEKLPAALQEHATNSPTLTMKLGKMIEGDFEPHFSVKHMLKDVQIADRLAKGLALDFGATNAAADVLMQELKNGRGDQDFASVARKYFPEPEKRAPIAEPPPAAPKPPVESAPAKPETSPALPAVAASPAGPMGEVKAMPEPEKKATEIRDALVPATGASPIREAEGGAGTEPGFFGKWLKRRDDP